MALLFNRSTFLRVLDFMLINIVLSAFIRIRYCYFGDVYNLLDFVLALTLLIAFLIYTFIPVFRLNDLGLLLREQQKVAACAYYLQNAHMTNFVSRNYIFLKSTMKICLCLLNALLLEQYSLQGITVIFMLAYLTVLLFNTIKYQVF
jgi:hypothetical protein